MSPHQCFFSTLRLRPALIRASRVLPSTPPLFHSIERHFLEGQFGGFSVSGIHRCSQKSQYGSRLTTPQKVYPWASGRIGETEGERPHKMKSCRHPFEPTDWQG